jgi:hypothetical protein
MHTKGLPILLHRHSSAAAKFLRISAQQFYAVFVEPLGASDDAAQIFCMGQSIEALEVLSTEAGDNRSMIVIAENSSVYHIRFPMHAAKQQLCQLSSLTIARCFPDVSGGFFGLVIHLANRGYHSLSIVELDVFGVAVGEYLFGV